ncbi:hypothetical protein QTP88_008533 [Uroleucon formosanum]
MYKLIKNYATHIILRYYINGIASPGIPGIIPTTKPQQPPSSAGNRKLTCKGFFVHQRFQKSL